MTAAETIAAQRCLRNSACSKPLGHAGFCDSGKSSSYQRGNSLAGLAAAAEQASHALPGKSSSSARTVLREWTIEATVEEWKKYLGNN